MPSADLSSEAARGDGLPGDVERDGSLPVKDAEDDLLRDVLPPLDLDCGVSLASGVAAFAAIDSRPLNVTIAS